MEITVFKKRIGLCDQETNMLSPVWLVNTFTTLESTLILLASGYFSISYRELKQKCLRALFVLNVFHNYFNVKAIN